MRFITYYLVRILRFFRPNPEYKKSEKEFISSLHVEARGLQRPLAVVAMLAWVNFAFKIDPVLHPEFPEFIFFRLALSASGIIVLIASFFEKLRGKGLGAIHFMLTFSFVSCAFFTGRIADDANYVSGFQILIMIVVLLPFTLKTMVAYYLASLVLFITAIQIYHPNLSTPSAAYSMNNVVIAYSLGSILGYSIFRFRFKLFIQRHHLNVANKDLSDILNSIDQGIITTDLQGKCNVAHSLQAETIFSRSEFGGLNLFNVLGCVDESKKKIFFVWLEMFGNPSKLRRWARYEPLAPIKEVTFRREEKDRIIALEYKPIILNDKLYKLMVLAKDVTKQREIEQRLRQSQQENEIQMQRILSLTGHDQAMLQMFLDSTTTMLDKYKTVQSLDWLSNRIDEAYRDMHTLKGNAGSFGFRALAMKCNKVEDLLERLRIASREPVNSVTLNEWTELICDVSAEFKVIVDLRTSLFSDGSDAIPVDKEIYDDFQVSLLEKKLRTPEEILLATYNFNVATLKSLCKKYQNAIDQYRNLRGKEIDDLEISNPDQKVHRDLMRLMDPAIVHLIRNAIDHGLESNDEREKTGKKSGKVYISYSEDEGKIKVSISDNGKGIDLRKVVEKGVEKKLISALQAQHMNESDILNLLFASGFSTSSEVTETSGRGVGLDVVKATVEKFGGGVTVNTELGKGTMFTIWLPKYVHFRDYLCALINRHPEVRADIDNDKKLTDLFSTPPYQRTTNGA